MPSFPDFLYELSPRDLVGQNLSPIFASAFTSALSTSLFISFTLNRGFCSIIENVVFYGTPGNTQGVTQLQLYLQPPDPSTALIPLDYIDFGASPTINRISTLRWYSGPGLAIPGDFKILCQALFSGAVNPNFLSASIVGMRVPIANIDRV